MGLNQQGSLEPASILELCDSLLLVPEASLIHSSSKNYSIDDNQDHVKVRLLLIFRGAHK